MSAARSPALPWVSAEMAARQPRSGQPRFGLVSIAARRLVVWPGLTALASLSGFGIAARAQEQTLPLLLAPPPPLLAEPLPQPGRAGLPAPTNPLGPPLQAQVSCPPLQQALQRLIGAESPVWSVTVTEPGGRLLADINGTTPRIPASNQKLLSTAFALDQLGPEHRLVTQLWRLPDGRWRLVGQGDPDLALPGLRQLLGPIQAPQTGESAQPLRLELAEEPRRLWWPAGWHPQDRLEAYGAPITRLALDGNALNQAVADPLTRLERLLSRSMSRPGTNLRLVTIPAGEPLPAQSQLVVERPSLPLHELLGLANTESHNFTAEVLLRQAAQQWDGRLAAAAATQWLSSQGLPMQGVQVVDGSGLDRANRVTSRFLASLLLRMDHHPYGRQYLQSMAVAGERGTLRRLFVGTPLQGHFRGKTGTISGVRAISGRLETADGVRYLSMVSNGAAAPNRTIEAILMATRQDQRCGGPETLASLP